MPGSIPTPTKTWDFGTSNANVNVAVTTNGAGLTLGRPLIRAIKNLLKGLSAHPITIKGSSDSVTAGMDGSDRWAADANLVWVQTSGVHSWIVWEFDAINDGSGHKLQICLDLTGGGINSGGIMQVYASAAAGFTGGTTSARPTATDEINVGSTASITFATSSTQHRVNVIAATDGTAYHVLVANGNNPNFYLGFFAPTPTIDAVTTGQPAGWSYPWLAIALGAATGNQCSAATMVSVYSARFSSRHSSTSLVCGIECEGGANVVKSGGAGAVANGITSQLVILGHGIWTSTVPGRYGFIPDLYFVSDTAFAAIGSTVGADDSHRRWMVAGCMLLPWTNDATVPAGS